MVKRLVSGMLLAFVLSSCGDDGSGSNPAEPVSEMTSSSSIIAEPESFSDKGTTSIKESSSSIGKSSCSSKDIKSAKESSSSKVKEASSSSKGSSNSAESSNDVGESSSSANDSSSSSEEKESSSSNVKTSSSSETDTVASSESPIETSSSQKIEESSSSMNSIYDAQNNTLTDLRDNQVYKTVTIGEQVWMAENLNYMPEDTAGTIFSGATVCGGGEEEIMEDSRKCDILGRLYLRSVALYKQEIFARQGICPDGWSIPKKNDWEDLIIFLGESPDSKMKINDNSMWPNSKHSNESGFSAKPSGNYFTTVGYSHNYNAYFFYWSTQSNPQFISLLDKDDTIIYSHGQPHVMGSIRCIKD